MNRRGLSPVIATVLLIALVLVLASIIFLWARAFFPEVIVKNEGPIQDSCENVVFEASASNNLVTVQNNGNIPLYTIQVAEKESGSLTYTSPDTPLIVVPGASGVYAKTISSDEVVVVPVLLGESGDGAKKAFVCDENSKTITVR